MHMHIGTRQCCYRFVVCVSTCTEVVAVVRFLLQYNSHGRDFIGLGVLEISV